MFIYPATIIEGTAQFIDIPEAITQGNTLDNCIKEGADALEEAIVGRVKRLQKIPRPSEFREGEYLIPLPEPTNTHLYDLLYGSTNQNLISAMKYFKLDNNSVIEFKLAQYRH